MSALETRLREETETITKPPTRWRNKWRATMRCTEPDGRILERGEVYWGRKVFPSKDLAETFAHAQLERCPTNRRATQYLGAFPVEEA